MRHAVVAIVLCVALPAGADGAFPDSMALFVPAAQPSTFVLATNFGLVLSEDAGASWTLVCENAILSYASLYQLGPDGTLYAVSTLGLASSQDRCNWQLAGGALTLAAVDDAFPDPSDAQKVLALARPVGDGGLSEPSGLFVSRDGASTFDLAWRPAGGGTLSGVEIARSAPNVVYVSFTTPGPHAWLARSSDGGASFTVSDQAALGAVTPRIVAVDPTNPDRLFLRLSSAAGGDALGVSDDGGATVRVALTPSHTLTGFLLRADGSVLVAASDGSSWRSTDGARTFAAWATGLHPRTFAERSGLLYVVADDLRDGFAIGVSRDGNPPFTPLMRYADISGPLACARVQSICAAPWAALQPLVTPGDAGAADLAAPVPYPHHAGCDVPDAPGGAAWLIALAAALALALRLRRRA